MRGLKGKSVIVTGGAKGIGAAIAKRFIEEGSVVSIFDIDADTAQATATELGSSGGTAEAHAVDLTDYAAVNTAVADVHGRHGLDVVVNNAGWDLFIPFTETEPAFWDKIIAINYRAPLNVLHAALPLMVAQNSGRIIGISSDAGRGGSSGEAVYSGCKAGIIALSKSLAREHSRHNITFNVVCPGPTQTPLFNNFLDGVNNPDKLVNAFTRAVPMGRLGEPDDIPGAVAFFASEDAGFVTGQVLSVSGGLTMVG